MPKQKTELFMVRLGKRHRRILKQYSRILLRSGAKRPAEADGVRVGIDLLEQKMRADKRKLK